jgi:hypothetical protein
MIIHVKKGNGECDGTNNRTIHLTGCVSIGDDHTDENDLNESNLGHDETLLDSLNYFGGFGSSVVGLTRVSWHFNIYTENNVATDPDTYGYDTSRLYEGTHRSPVF